MTEQKILNLLDASGSYSRDALKTTSYLDDYIVRGQIYTISLIQELTAATPIYFTSEYAPGSEIELVFLLPISINTTSGYSVLTLYEDSEYTGGTPLTAVNRNRLSAKTADVLVNAGATGSVKGITLFTAVYGAEALPQGGGGGGGAATNAVVLDKDKKYLFELTNSEDANVGIIAEFGEI